MSAIWRTMTVLLRNWKWNAWDGRKTLKVLTKHCLRAKIVNSEVSLATEDLCLGRSTMCFTTYDPLMIWPNSTIRNVYSEGMTKQTQSTNSCEWVGSYCMNSTQSGNAGTKSWLLYVFCDPIKCWFCMYCKTELLRLWATRQVHLTNSK